MENAVVYTMLSVVAVSLIAVITILPLMRKKGISERTLLILVSLSAGTLFGGAILHFIPESISLGGYTLGTALAILLGITVFFVLEKFVHWKHDHSHPTDTHKKVHGHAYHLATMNIVGDALHNFLDGLVIAASYLVSVPLGIAATIGIILHEIPQEVADFGVLLYAGLTKMKALLFNFLSAATAIVGAIIGLILGSKISGFSTFMIPFTAGVFLYIAGSNLVPELHKHCKFKESLLHILAMAAGVGLMIAIIFLAPGHTH